MRTCQTIHGCRPTSAAAQPIWLAAIGSATDGTQQYRKIRERLEFASKSFPRFHSSSPSAISAPIALPKNTIPLNEWKLKLTGAQYCGLIFSSSSGEAFGCIFSRNSSEGRSSSPETFASDEPNAR